MEIGGDWGGLKGNWELLWRTGRGRSATGCNWGGA